MTTLFTDRKPVILRPYQQQMLSAWQAAKDRGIQRGLIVAATGTGKTTIFGSIIGDAAMADPSFTALVLAHRKELLDQAGERIGSMYPELSVGIESGENKAVRGTRVVVGSVQTLGITGSERLDWLGPQLVVCDEAHHACFVAGTMVDGRPIESVRVGDTVLAWNHQTKNAESKRVTAVMSRRPSALVRLWLSSGAKITCTREHPVYVVASDSYEPASDIAGKEVWIAETHLQRLRSPVQPHTEAHILLARMPGHSPDSAGKARGEVPPLRSALRGDDQEREGASSEGSAGVLLGAMLQDGQGRAIQSHGFIHEPEVCICPNETAQPHVLGDESREGFKSLGGEALSDRERGEWPVIRASEAPGRSSGLEDRGHGESDAKAGLPRDANGLQGGHRQSRPEDCDRGGRSLTQGLEGSGGRSEARRNPESAWVDRVEVLEPGCDGTFGGLCPDGLVYNLEVEEHHNYFANGVLVHNCASTYQTAFRRFGCYEDNGCYLLGVTATPHRLDNLALVGDKRQAIFEEVVFCYDIIKAIKDGFLVDLRGYRAAADMDLSGVKTVAGDYKQDQLEKVVNVHPVTELAFKSWSDVAADRPTIVFCAGVDHAKNVAEVFQGHGVRAEAIYGDMPKEARVQAIERFRKRETQVLTNMDILTEGFDAQHCGCIILLRPTKSWSLFTQMVGRGLRTLPGVIEGIGEPMLRRSAISESAKPDCIVIDIVSNTEMHSLATKPGGNTRPSLQELVGLPNALDLEGRTIAEAIDDFEALPEPVRAAAYRRNTSFSGLSAVLTQVEMLSELEVPEEVNDAGAQLYWLKVGEDHYAIDCGASDAGLKRHATMTGDMLGKWTLRLTSSQSGATIRDEVFDLPDELGAAFAAAEQIVQDRFFGVARIAGRNATWRTGAATDAQLKFLERLGVDRTVFEFLDKGKASAMISMLQAQQKGASR